MKRSDNSRWDIKNLEAIKIDWQNAIKEAEEYAVSDKTLVDFDTHLRAYDFVCTIKRFYRDNNVQGYLDFIDENGYIFRRGATR